MLPNFLIIGAAKSGTTSLYNYLKQHPEIYMSPVKEPYFFTFMNEKVDLKGPFDKATQEQIITNIKDYKKLFEKVKDEKAIGECSNSYLFFYEKSGKNIKDIIPDCKIIAILRNPIERAFSHYTQMVMIGHENLSFREAIDSEEKRKKNGWRWHYQYIGQSMYSKQLSWYISNFGRKNVKIYLFEDIKNNPEKLLEDIFDFLKVSKNIKINFNKVYNVSGIPKIKFIHDIIIDKKLRNIGKILPVELKMKILNTIFIKNLKKPIINENDKQFLKNIFFNDILELQKICNRNLMHWFD